MGTTKTTQRCMIQEYSADMTPAGKRWTVAWDTKRDEKPVRFVCATKVAATQLAAVLDSTDILWVLDAY